MSSKSGIFLFVLVCGIGYCAGGGCEDKRSDCQQLAARGDCHSNPYATLRECPVSCEVPCKPCQDRLYYCGDLTEDCHSNPYSTAMSCPETCGICWGCEDQRDDCEQLAADNHCHSNPYATLRECPVSCDVPCSPCMDHRPDCASLTEHCHSNPYSTAMDCPLTCGIC